MNNYFYYFGFVFLLINIIEIIQHILRGKEKSKFNEIQESLSEIHQVVKENQTETGDPAKVLGVIKNWWKKWGADYIVAMANVIWWGAGMIWSEQKLFFALTFFISLAVGLLVTKFIKNKSAKFWLDLIHGLVGLGFFIFIMYNHFYPTI